MPSGGGIEIPASGTGTTRHEARRVQYVLIERLGEAETFDVLSERCRLLEAELARAFEDAVPVGGTGRQQASRMTLSYTFELPRLVDPVELVERVPMAAGLLVETVRPLPADDEAGQRAAIAEAVAAARRRAGLVAEAVGAGPVRLARLDVRSVGADGSSLSRNPRESTITYTASVDAVFVAGRAGMPILTPDGQP